MIKVPDTKKMEFKEKGKIAPKKRPSLCPDSSRQLSADDELRLQIHVEIEKRTKACGHKRYTCHLPRLEGYTRCNQHILDEPSAPYRRCRYNGVHRCDQPAPISNNKRDAGFCFEHARTAMGLRARSLSKPTPKPSAETSLLSLTHHVIPERVRTASSASQVSVVSEASDPYDLPAVQAPDPFKQVDARIVNASIGPNILDCWTSSSGSEDDMENLCRVGGADEDSSGAEDTLLDTKPLRFAGIYTSEEAVRETGTILRRLQALYLEQLSLLSFKLKEARRTYLESLKVERETRCSIYMQGAQGAEDRVQLAKLKAMSSYRKRHGVDAILHRKLHDKRAKVSEGPASARGTVSGSRCCFTEGGVKCIKVAVPSTRHCPKHILNDRHQVLFRACGAQRAGITCQEPTAALHPSATCSFHADIPAYQMYSLKKHESDSEETPAELESDQQTPVKAETPKVI